MYLAAERGIRSEQELLSCLTLGIECTRHLCASERTVGKHASILAGEGNALRHALVDDVV